VSRYELLERIGVGGMAEVFRGLATSVGGFEKPVAIKKILPHLVRDERFVRMLIGEAKILANLRQRNIVQIYDVAQGDDGEFFLVMEFVDGPDLGALYERMEQEGERMSISSALHIGAEVCEALDHAHRAPGADGKTGLIHRDVSQSNVLLSYSGEVKLTDFGIAKQQDERSIVASLKGKFAYMSPEQARAQPLDGRTDLYSLGVVLFEMLVGRRLFSHLNDLDALRFVREGRVPRPTHVDPSFPRDLEEVLMRALAPDRNQRYKDAAEMGQALQKYRYGATSGGDPGRELAKLVTRYFKPKAPKAPEGTVIRMHTVAGFPSGEMELAKAATVAAPPPSDSGLLSLDDDAPTRHVQLGAVSRDARDSMQTGTFRSSRSSRAQSFDLGESSRDDDVFDVPPLPPLPPVRPAQPRAATPTVKDVFPAGALLPQDDAIIVQHAPWADEHALQRRRVLLIAIVVMVFAALVAFVIAGTMSSGEPGEPGIFGTPPGTGESLERPEIKQPVKRRP
jgi:serine/threonine protein kinase